MKRLKPSFVLFLIVFGLLISGAGEPANGSPSTPSQNKLQSQPAKQQSKGPIEGKDDTGQQKQSSKDSSVIIQATPTEDFGKVSKRDTEKGIDESSEFMTLFGHKVKITDALLATFTFLLATFTLLLVGIGAWQGYQLKRTVTATKEAVDTAVAGSMPFLSPWIVPNMRLHSLTLPEDQPVDQPVRFNAHVDFVFENFGRTPGEIRELRADLFLCERDEFPIVEWEKLPFINYQPIVAGDSRGKTAMMGVAERTRSMTLTRTEFAELLAESGDRFRRFALIGRVIFDDFFGNRHTRRFCVKLRLLDKGLFQLVRGGQAYNRVDREKIPQQDPLKALPF